MRALALQRRFFLLAMLSLSIASASTQEVGEGALLPRVGLLSVDVGQSRTGAVLGSVVEDTIELALLQLGEYEFVPPEELEAAIAEAGPNDAETGETAGGTVDAAAIAGSGNVEFLLLQRITEGEEESTVSLRIYDALRGGFRGTHSGSFRSTLEVFDAADAAILGALGDLAGTEVAFGSLRIDATGAVRPYTVLLGEARYGDSPRSLTRLLTGTYPLEVRTSDGYLLVRQGVTIEEGGASTVRLVFPEFFPEELQDIRRGYRRLVESGIGELIQAGGSGGSSSGESSGVEPSEEVERLLSVPAVAGVRGIARNSEQLLAPARGTAAAARESVAYRDLPAAEVHQRITSVGRSTVGALATLARRVTIPEDRTITIDGSPSEWQGAERFFLEPEVDWVGRVGFALHTGQLMMLFELTDPELLQGSVTNFVLVFSGTGGRELSLEFRSDQQTAAVGTATWNMRGAYLATGREVLEIAVPINAFAREFDRWEQLRVRLRAIPVTASGTVPLRDTGFQGAVMPLIE